MQAQPRVFKKPTSLTEIQELQRDTTELLRSTRIRIAQTKLCSGRATDAQKAEILSKFTDSNGRVDVKALEAAAGPLAESTAANYTRRAKACFEAAYEANEDVWEVVASRCSTQGSYFTARAGMQYWLIKMLVKAKKAIDNWYRLAESEKEMHESTFKDALVLVPLFANSLASVPLGKLPEKFKGDGRSKRRPNSKSQSLKGLPDDWREQLAAVLPATVRKLWLMQCVTGCRPVELARGVTAVLTQKGELLLSVVGAKQSKHAGQSLRTFRVKADTGVAKLLADMLDVGELCASAPLVGKVDSYRKFVAREAQEVIPSSDPCRRVSCYSARHMFKVNARAAGLNREELAKAMGHSTTRSACYYGSGGRSGSGAVTPTDVHASRPVKPRPQPPAMLAAPSRLDCPVTQPPIHRKMRR